MFSNNLDFDQNDRNNSICRRNSWKSRFQSKFSIISISLKIYQNLDFSRTFRKIAIMVKIHTNHGFSKNSR